ncbi:DUF938 domain-containing protein [Shewanella inventionis]|uniref:Methylase n=1 Tax=Shewanella inventionis TaxID=1738770 RepID=A0ABQ1J6X0_9GAMM|nr:DUF938 domain-containing protein [Shewanella inventionis]MCL1157612.1 class I SAM-dependent methyltransferase [Shewanella inventionis]GGB59370.1 methylase [Shewanella inventionis]
MPHIIPLAQLPFSQACENNKSVIVDNLFHWFANSSHVLEIGSGTGQHCTYFAKHLSHLHWQPSDQASYIPTLHARIAHFPLANLAPPIEQDVSTCWPQLPTTLDAIFTANTLHIMSKENVVALFSGCAKHLASKGCLVIYGPFNYSGNYTSDSNRQFDVWLKQQNPVSGIRDIEWITSLAHQQSFELKEDIAMPANNRMLLFTLV